MKIQVRVKPNSKTEEIGQEGKFFLVRVKEPAKEGRANRAVIRLVAQHFNVSQSRVRIVSGFNSRNKIIEVGD